MNTESMRRTGADQCSGPRVHPVVVVIAKAYTNNDWVDVRIGTVEIVDTAERLFPGVNTREYAQHWVTSVFPRDVQFAAARRSRSSGNSPACWPSPIPGFLGDGQRTEFGFAFGEAANG